MITLVIHNEGKSKNSRFYVPVTQTANLARRAISGSKLTSPVIVAVTEGRYDHASVQNDLIGRIHDTLFPTLALPNL